MLLRGVLLGCVTAAALLGSDCRKKVDVRPYCSVGGSEFDTIVDAWNAARRNTDSGSPSLHHEGRGNRTAAAPLLRGACGLAAVTERLPDRDYSRLLRAFGKEPTVLAVAMEAVVFVVPERSPLTAISVEGARRVFSGPPVSSNDLGTTAAAQPLQPFGVNSASDRYRWFKQAVLSGANVASHVIEVPGPLELVDRVALSPGGIGYARPRELKAGVRALPMSSGNRTVTFSESAAGSGDYPLARYFYLYLPPPGHRSVNADVIAFVEFAVGPRGQAALRPLGLYPVPEVERRRNEALLAPFRDQRSSK